jgi:CelD/BcsL family acetyltransferase involved in cellulose biosynthesis
MEKLTYKYPIGAALLDNEETRRTLLHELTQGWLRLYVLCIDGAAKAYWKLAVYGRTAFSESLSYDPSFERDRIGHVCQQITLQALCNEHRVDKVDFGFGDAQYKRSLGDVVWHEATIQIFHRSVRGLVLNLLLSSCKLLERSLRYLGERFRITSRLKSKWRTFLRKEDS